MGLMDFLKKKSDAGIGAADIGSSNSFDNTFSMDSTSNPPQSNFGSGFQPEQQLSPSVNFSTMNNSAFGQSSMSQPQGPDISKDLQMISLKLDAIKSELDAMNQRLKSLESIAEREQIKAVNKKWY